MPYSVKLVNLVDIVYSFMVFTKRFNVGNRRSYSPVGDPRHEEENTTRGRLDKQIDLRVRVDL